MARKARKKKGTLLKGKKEGAQRGSAIGVKGYSYMRKGKRITVKSYRRGRPGGVLG